MALHSAIVNRKQTVELFIRMILEFCLIMSSFSPTKQIILEVQYMENILVFSANLVYLKTILLFQQEVRLDYPTALLNYQMVPFSWETRHHKTLIYGVHQL